MFNILQHTTLKFVLMSPAHKLPIIRMIPVPCSRDKTVGNTARQTLSEEASIPTCWEHDWLDELAVKQFYCGFASRNGRWQPLHTHRYLLVPCNGSLIRYTTPPSPHVLHCHKAKKYVSQGIAVSCNIRIRKGVLDIIMGGFIVRLFMRQEFKSKKITYLQIFTISEHYADATNKMKGAISYVLKGCSSCRRSTA
jgi:hypothetical protein